MSPSCWQGEQELEENLDGDPGRRRRARSCLWMGSGLAGSGILVGTEMLRESQEELVAGHLSVLTPLCLKFLGNGREMGKWG